MKEQKIKIKELIIKSAEAEFEVLKKEGDTRNEQLAKKQAFIDSHCVYEISERDWYNSIKYEIKYYFGYIEFLPTSTDSASLKLNIQMDNVLLKLVQSLCLENVVEVCEKQTQLFKEIFKESVKETQAEVENKISKSFLSLPFFKS